MKVLVIGSGGREHAICWKLRQSKKVKRLFCAPGNPGICRVAERVATKANDVDGLLKFAKEEMIDLTIVGPEEPLSLGLVDTFQAAGLRIFGPSKAAAQLEASKSFAKEVMKSAGVPTARSQVFDNKVEGLRYAKAQGAPIVLKADGLAAGKGVVVCMNDSQIEPGLNFIFDELGSARVLVEEFLEGVEASYIIASNGSQIVPLAASHDHKTIFEHNRGPNTGGMGTISPTHHLSVAQEQQALETVMQPMIDEMKRRGTPFSGFLYGGLMISPAGKINVIEFNARLGDPETQSILRRLESDLFELLWALSKGSTDSQELPNVCWSSQHAVCVVLASDGYPLAPKTGDVINGIELAMQIPSIEVFHAGTTLNAKNELLTSGGRVLNVTSIGPDLNSARSRCYQACDMIQYRGRQLRRDIGEL